MIHFMMLMSRQGKVRLTKWYTTYSQKERQKVAKEITPLILARPLKLCNFLDWKVSCMDSNFACRSRNRLPASHASPIRTSSLFTRDMPLSTS